MICQISHFFYANMFAEKTILIALKKLNIFKISISLGYKMLNSPIYFAKQGHLQL